MANSVIINVSNQTGAVTQAGFGLTLVFDATKDVAYQEVSDTSEITGFVSTDTAYKMANVVLAQTQKLRK